MIELPPIIRRNRFRNEEEFVDFAYALFIHDLVVYPPTLNGTKITCMSRKTINEKYLDSFWHIATEGSHTKNDRFDADRIERIPWINPIITGQPASAWLMWNKPADRGNTRTLIYSKTYKYLVIVEHIKKGIITFWTAYPIDNHGGHHERKLLKEYSKYCQ